MDSTMHNVEHIIRTRITPLLIAMFFGVFLWGVCGVSTSHAATTTITYSASTTGTSFVVPNGVSSITIKTWGAGAGGGRGAASFGTGGAGGGGGYSEATISVTPGETLTVRVGGGGTSGTGTTGTPGAGGGYSGLFRSSTPLIMAGGGGGGGGGGYTGAGNGGAGGGGGATTGATGSNATSGGNGGSGGTQSAGGAGGTGTAATDGEAGEVDGRYEGGDGSGSGAVGGTGGGEEIGSTPGFQAPTSQGSPHNEWTNGTNALSSDNVYSTAASADLRQSYSVFGFNVPGGNTVTGIEVKLEASGSTAAGTIQVALSWNGDSSVTATKATSVLTGSDVVYTLGSPSDTWGRSWTPAELGDANFFVRVVSQPSSNTVRVDAIQVKPYHQAGGGGGGGGGEI